MRGLPLVLDQLLNPIGNVEVMLRILIPDITRLEEPQAVCFSDCVLRRLFVGPVALSETISA
jgi:hypothetical protein